MLTLKVDHDPDVECPSDFGGWKLYSFSRRHASFTHHEDVGLSLVVGDDGNPKIESPGLRRKMERGLAFILSCYQHGNIHWSLKGRGPRCPWDTAMIGGILVWEDDPKNLGAKSPEDRRADAERFLDTYNAWANGETYWFSLTDENGDTVDSCGGFIGLDSLWETVESTMNENGLSATDLAFSGGALGSAEVVRSGWERYRGKGARV